jgi:hypothetical protein
MGLVFSITRTIPHCLGSTFYFPAFIRLSEQLMLAMGSLISYEDFLECSKQFFCHEPSSKIGWAL